MKLKSLLLGSLALAGVSGLTAGAHAADLAQGVMSSLDTCDNLGLSGLTVSSDDNCLQVTGGVSYQFVWGDYKAGVGSRSGGLGIVGTPDDTYRIPQPGDSSGTTGRATDWDSQMIAWLQVVGTADSDFGPAKVVIKLKSEQYRHSANGYGWYDGDDTGGGTTTIGGPGTSTGPGYSEYKDADTGPSGTVRFDQAYVSVGDSTILTAGKTGSIVNTDDDTPLNYLGLFNSDNVGTGVLWSVNNSAAGDRKNTDGSQFGNVFGDNSGAHVQTGGHSIQVVSSLGNGVTLKGAIEDLQDTNVSRAGTAIGVISYAGDNLTAHLSLIETGILDGHGDATAYHAGITGTFDKFKLVAAIAGDSSGYYDALASGQISLDMFKLAASVEATHNGTIDPNGPASGLSNAFSSSGVNGLGFGASAGLTVSDGVSINLGGRYFDGNTATDGNEGYQAAVSLVAAVTETLTLTGEVGVYGTDGNIGTNGNATGPNGGFSGTPIAGQGSPGNYYNTYYGAASVAWAPGGGFTSSVKGEAFSNGAYRATFNAAKNFQ